MVGWHHQLDGYEFEQALGVGDRQGSLACCSPWGRKESDATEHEVSREQDGREGLEPVPELSHSQKASTLFPYLLK